MTSKIVNTTPDIIINKIFTHSLHGFTTYVKQYNIAEYSFECFRNNRKKKTNAKVMNLYMFMCLFSLSH